MRKYGCLGLKWLRDKLSHVFSEEKNKNNKQNIKNSQRCSATTNISQESSSFFFSFFLVFQFFLWLCGSFYKFASKKIEKMKKKKSRFSPTTKLLSRNHLRDNPGCDRNPSLCATRFAKPSE